MCVRHHPVCVEMRRDAFRPCCAAFARFEPAVAETCHLRSIAGLRSASATVPGIARRGFPGRLREAAFPAISRRARGFVPVFLLYIAIHV